MPAARQTIVFFLNGERCEVAGADALLTVSEFLRDRRALVGTKIVCSEGDCGSCTVLVGRPAEGSLTYRPIDCCIQFVFQLDGSHLVTVEGLASNGQLTAVQQAMVDCHGSQCGFCTPGFVMAMTAVVEEHDNPPTEPVWRERLTGNLCRCTGYSQIIEAGQQAACEATSLDDRFPEGDILEGLESGLAEPFHVSSSAGQVFSPVSLEDAVSFRRDNAGCCVVAGATDLGVQRNKGRTLPQVLLDLNRIAPLRKCEVTTDADGQTRLTMGAMATWTQVLQTCHQRLPEFAKILSVFGSPQIRHTGTVGGNLVNASPIADSLPLLFVLHAQLTISSASGSRDVDINNFYRGYKQFDLRPDELLTEIHFSLPADDVLLKLYKVSRRKDLDISTFTAAVMVRVENDLISEARLAYGAVGPTVLRLPQTEASLVGQPFSLATMQAAGDQAVQEITPLSDVRGAAEYRNQLARNVLTKFYTEQATATVANR